MNKINLVYQLKWQFKMRNIASILWVLGISLFFSTNALASTKVNDDHYLLGPGDQIQILVYNEADLSMKLIIDQSGNIIYPLVGKLQLTGKTPDQVATNIRDKLKNGFINNPMVTVIIVKFRDIYVSGEVRVPGSYQYQPGLTLEKAIALAGGFTDRADRSDVDMRTSNGQLLKDVSSIQTVNPGDTIIVDQSFF